MSVKSSNQFHLFRAIVCDELTSSGFKGNAWLFSGDLDMSFDELKDQSVSSWRAAIRKDLEDYKRDFPEDFHE